MTLFTFFIRPYAPYKIELTFGSSMIHYSHICLHLQQHFTNGWIRRGSLIPNQLYFPISQCSTSSPSQSLICFPWRARFKMFNWSELRKSFSFAVSWDYNHWVFTNFIYSCQYHNDLVTFIIISSNFYTTK